MSFIRLISRVIWEEAILKASAWIFKKCLRVYFFFFRSQLEKQLWRDHRGIARQVRRRMNRLGSFRYKEAVGPVLKHSGVLDALLPDTNKSYTIWIETGTACAELARYIDREFVNGQEPHSCNVEMRTNNFLVVLLLVPRRSFVVMLLGGDHYDPRYMATFRKDEETITDHVKGCEAIFMTSSGTAILADGPNSLEKNALFKKTLVKIAWEQKVPIFSSQ